MIRMIVAHDANNGIARHGKIPWLIPADLEHFKSLTTGSTVLMGQKTFETIGHALKDRQNVIASRTERHIDGLLYVTDPEFFAENVIGDVWIIGGSILYKNLLHLAQELYVTKIDFDFDCDKFFPEYGGKFKLESESQIFYSNRVPYTFQKWTRTKS